MAFLEHPFRTSTAAFVFILCACDSSPRPMCGDPPALEHATHVVTSGPTGSGVARDTDVATYTCEPGYVAAASTLLCAPGDTEWSGFATDCTPTIYLDAVTGLEWQVEPMYGRWTEAAASCASVTLDGGGFRLPTLRELLSIVDYSSTRPVKVVPPLEGPGDDYWSSNTYSALTAAMVAFDDGRIMTTERTNPRSIRCVRGPDLPGAAWTSNGDGTATDAETGFVWEAVLSATEVAGLTYVGATNHCAGLTTRGGGWRVPSLPELQATFDYDASPWFDVGIFTDGPWGRLWTSSPYWSSADRWAVGTDLLFERLTEFDSARVRCVKDAL